VFLQGAVGSERRLSADAAGALDVFTRMGQCHLARCRLCSRCGSGAADPRGQFEPALAFDGQGAAMAVWTRIKDAAFTGTEVDAMAATMEIVSAKWNPTTGVRGAATALTDNAFLDHKPRLAGPLSDGGLILTCRMNASGCRPTGWRTAVPAVRANGRPAR